MNDGNKYNVVEVHNTDLAIREMLASERVGQIRLLTQKNKKERSRHDMAREMFSRYYGLNDVLSSTPGIDHNARVALMNHVELKVLRWAVNPALESAVISYCVEQNPPTLYLRFDQQGVADKPVVGLKLQGNGRIF